MTLFEIVFLLITLAWFFEFLLFRNRGETHENKVERFSYRIILSAILLTVLSTLLLREFSIIVVSSPIIVVIGLVFYGTGVFLRYWGILYLKEQFSRDVSVKQGDTLVSDGPYKRLRHPLYTGLVFIIIGIPFGLEVPWMAVPGGMLVIWALIFRINVEERMLTDIHGEVYRNWCAKRYRLIPFIY
ncbi:methyltransferase family protein [Thalassobacillus hwangdonensis]|uniref:Methyltransferase family protein n=1 Tax=Thalassobacillus hwangdonensis TaxID=546108 RepID=A0ABW3L3D1_9BACI